MEQEPNGTRPDQHRGFRFLWRGQRQESPAYLVFAS